MMKHFILKIPNVLLLLFLFNTYLGVAQNSNSLKIEVENIRDDTSKVLHLIKLSGRHGLLEDVESITYAKEAYDLSIKLNYTLGKIKACINLGESYSNIGDYDLASKYAEEALKMCGTLNNQGILSAKAHFIIAGIYTYKGDYDKAIGLYLRYINTFDNKRYSEEYATVLHNIAIIYFHTFQLNKAEENALKSKIIFEKLQDTLSILSSSNLLAAIYYDREEYSKALTYYQNIVTQSETLRNNNYLIKGLNGIGIIYADTKRYNDAIPFIKRAISLSELLEDKQSQITCLLNLGICYSGINNQSEAINTFNRSLALAKKIGDKHSIKEVYYFMTDALEKKGDLKAALKSLRNFSEVNDSIYNEESSKQINEFSAKYEKAKNEKEIVILNNALDIKQRDQSILNNKIERRNSVIIGTIVGSCLIIFIIGLLFNRRRLIQRVEFQSYVNAQREQNAVDIFHAQENEQGRIAKDLHDSVGIYLATLKLNLQSYEENIPRQKSEDFKKSLNLIDDLSKELRNIIKNLSNETLVEHGLVVASKELISSVNAFGSIKFDFHTHGVKSSLGELVELNLYRITQELIANCLKYSHATQAVLQLLADDKQITLMFEDNGIGFERVFEHKGMGLKNIDKRVSFLSGNLRFESNPENGSVYIIEIPIKS